MDACRRRPGNDWQLFAGSSRPGPSVLSYGRGRKRLRCLATGPVGLPVRAPLAPKPIAVVRPAMFKHGEETLTDAAVRDTWELTPALGLAGEQ